MEKRKGKKWFYVFVVVVLFGVFSTGVKAEEIGGMSVDFHGYLESNVVLRDNNGIQRGFMDSNEVVQQRNTLKFDIDVDPKLEWGPLSLAKIHLTYRGAYDSIFDLRKGAYGDIPDKVGTSRFDFGKRDIKWENDLREAFVDITYRGPLGSGFFRPGRQIVSWGETSGFVLLDVINPLNNSFQMFFQNPDDLMIPIWMGRLNYSIPRQPTFGLNFDLLFIPDIRPSQLGPLAGNFEAPYVDFLPFALLRGFTVRQEVPTDEREYGAKVTAEIGERLSVSLVYFRGVRNDLALDLTDFVNTPAGPFPTGARLVYQKQTVYGGYFSYQFIPLDIIIRGEFARSTNNAFFINFALADFVVGEFGPALVPYKLKTLTQTMLAIDKNILVKWLAPHQNTNFTIQWIRKIINGYDSAIGLNPASFFGTSRVVDIYAFLMNTYWWSGKLNPVLFVAYSPDGGGQGWGNWMMQPSLTYNFSPKWYAKVAMQVFLGSETARTGFQPFVRTSELTFKLGYQW